MYLSKVRVQTLLLKRTMYLERNTSYPTPLLGGTKYHQSATKHHLPAKGIISRTVGLSWKPVETRRNSEGSGYVFFSSSPATGEKALWQRSASRARGL